MIKTQQSPKKAIMVVTGEGVTIKEFATAMSNYRINYAASKLRVNLLPYDVDATGTMLPLIAAGKPAPTLEIAVNGVQLLGGTSRQFCLVSADITSGQNAMQDLGLGDSDYITFVHECDSRIGFTTEWGGLNTDLKEAEEKNQPIVGIPEMEFPEYALFYRQGRPNAQPAAKAQPSVQTPAPAASQPSPQPNVQTPAPAVSQPSPQPAPVVQEASPQAANEPPQEEDSDAVNSL